jgi:hypothetical protein
VKQSRIVQEVSFILLLVGSLAALTWANYRFVVENPGGNDFLARWNGARYWVTQGISPYDQRVSLSTQRYFYGRPAQPEKGEDMAHFVYPFYSMLFFAPFGMMDYTLARTVWMTVLECSLFGLAFLSFRLVKWSPPIVERALVVLFVLFWYHSVRALVVGQFAVLNALLITAALLFILRGKDIGAGILLALSTTKPQMVFLLVPFVLLWACSRRRWRIWGAFFATLAVLLAGSLTILPDWPLQMLRQVVQYPSYTEIGSPLSIIAGGVPQAEPVLNTMLHAALFIYLIVEWALAWKKTRRWFLWTALLTLVVTNLIALRTATTNYVVLVPVLFLMFQVMEERWKLPGRLGVYLMLVLLGVGLWILFLNTVEGNVEHPWMYLPLPLVSLFGLWWVRWWVVRASNLGLR